MSISSMASAAIARRPDFVPLGVPIGLSGIALAATSSPTLLPDVSVPAPPAQPGATGFPTPPAQPAAAPVPAAVSQPTAVRASSGTSSTAASWNVSTALQVITTYIPTEVLTLYVAVLAALRNPSSQRVAAASTVFWGFLLATPLIVWLVYAAKIRSADSRGALPFKPAAWPVWEMCAATIAFTAWALALPDSPFMETVTSAIGGLVVLMASTLLGLAAPVFQRPLGT
jgi:hypothetical protein